MKLFQNFVFHHQNNFISIKRDTIIVRIYGFPKNTGSYERDSILKTIESYLLFPFV